MSEFNLYQNEAIQCLAAEITVLAGPGSGKTRTLVGRVQRLIEFGVRPGQIVVITFTNAAADELNRRLGVALGYCGTLHGFMLRLLQSNGRLVGFTGPLTVLDEDDAMTFKKETIERLHYRGSMESFNTALVTPIDKTKMMTQTQIAAAGYHRALIRANMVDFDSILVLGYELLCSPSFPLPLPYLHLLVDEYQDSGDWDERIYKALQIKNKFFVGDPDQCQPAGTKIRMADGVSNKLIEDIAVGDKVLTYDRHSKVVVKNGVVSAVSRRAYNGKIIKVCCGGRYTYCTPNHKWLARWPSGADRENKSLWCTYLMRKGDWFRVGTTRFFRSSGIPGEPIIGLTTRFNQEKADSAWILKVHTSSGDAIADEQIISATYGLPQTCFLEGNAGWPQSTIEKIFSCIPNQLRNATKCLQDHNRELEFPLFDSGHKRTRRTVQEIHACNLIDGIMFVPVVSDFVHWKNRGGRWEVVKISSSSFFGDVYSLDVTPHHRYIADGIVTCNSIYSFRGGNIKNIIATAARSTAIYLELNYRSDKAICNAAQLLIEHNTNRISKRTIPFSQNNGSVDYWFNIANPGREVSAIADDISKRGNANDCAVLVRTNFLVNQVRDMLESFGVKCRKPDLVSGGFPYWKQARVFASLLANPDNDFVARQWLHLNNGQKESNRIALVAASRKESINAFHLKLPREIPVTRVPALMADAKIFALTVAEVSKLISTLPTGAGVSELCVAMTAEPQKNSFAPSDESGVVVTTMHGAKGREWGTVYLPAFEQEIIPSKKKGIDVEEERRLAYVAFTRAKNRLVVCVCKERQQTEWQDKPQPSSPSQFVTESQIS